ncbi:MAG: glycosyl hydrolase family protein [Lentisphaerae bacterium]|nr:MAG: glycosyl hydrolase family protein [Lentisphaerota bacterium]
MKSIPGRTHLHVSARQVPEKRRHHIAVKFSMLALMGVAVTMVNADETPKSKVPRICMTEYHGFRHHSLEQIRKRFDYYRKLGVDMIRIGVDWLDRKPMVSALKEYPFRIKLILPVMWLPREYREKYPDGAMIDEHGKADKHFGPWSPAFTETTYRTGRRHLQRVIRSGLSQRVEEVVVDLGPACEPIYPANWTLKRKGEEAFWCYSALAQKSFRETMQKKYSSIEKANDAWRLKGAQRFKDWESVTIPKPRTSWAKGPFWNDMLTWYRDSKRRMIINRIEQTQKLVKEFLRPGVKCIVYLPGHAYTQGDWNRAVREASGPPSIRLMMDNDWLMKEAVKRGCLLQYTGVENAYEVRNIVRKLKAMGSDAYKWMWGENAGLERCGRKPMHLAQVITENELRGIDYTWCNWIFEEDGVTPNKIFSEFAAAVKLIRQRDSEYRNGYPVNLH